VTARTASDLASTETSSRASPSPPRLAASIHSPISPRVRSGSFNSALPGPSLLGQGTSSQRFRMEAGGTRLRERGSLLGLQPIGNMDDKEGRQPQTTQSQPTSPDKADPDPGYEFGNAASRANKGKAKADLSGSGSSGLQSLPEGSTASQASLLGVPR
jgi:hypothetical protein